MNIRPIDANALWKRCSDLYDKYDNICCAYEEIDNAPTLSLNTLRDAIYQDTVEHGLWEIEDTIKFSEDHHGLRREVAVRHVCAAMIAGELFELDGESIKGDAYAEELADVIIMSFSVAGYLGIDIDAAIRRNMEINKGRPWKHGKEDK